MAREIQREKRIVPALLPYVGQALLPALYNALLATFGAAALAAAGITITQNLRDRSKQSISHNFFSQNSFTYFQTGLSRKAVLLKNEKVLMKEIHYLEFF